MAAWPSLGSRNRAAPPLHQVAASGPNISSAHFSASAEPQPVQRALRGPLGRGRRDARVARDTERAMSQENVEVVRRILRALQPNRRDGPTASWTRRLCTTFLAGRSIRACTTDTREFGSSASLIREQWATMRVEPQEFLAVSEMMSSCQFHPSASAGKAESKRQPKPHTSGPFERRRSFVRRPSRRWTKPSKPPGSRSRRCRSETPSA